MTRSRSQDAKRKLHQRIQRARERGENSCDFGIGGHSISVTWDEDDHFEVSIDGLCSAGSLDKITAAVRATTRWPGVRS